MLEGNYEAVVLHEVYQLLSLVLLPASMSFSKHAFCPCLPAVLRQGLAFSQIYRFSLSDGTLVAAQTKSKLIRSPTTNEPQLVISLHMLHRKRCKWNTDFKQSRLST
ncbi:nuclear receptor coactivator 2-like [Otolemur garnettii]|uniref:nuclear receptor coactivator 2-like n=1 Tax=Otolemur garnettii TaxID=30611 RepID=UPI0006444507|nr:nuclear receptor coactivator 2-like [Otolemur garnettii]